MEKFNKGISLEKLADILLCLFIATAYLSERTILGQVTMLLYIIICLGLILIHRKINLSKYFVLEFLFIGYSIFQNIKGITINTEISNDMIKTLLLCTLVYVCIYNHALFRKNYMHILKLFFFSNVWAIVIDILLNIGTIFSSRTGYGINILGIQIGGVSPISVGWMAGVCMVLATIIYDKNQKKHFWSVFIIMLFALVTSGTRKAFLFIPIALLGWFYFSNKRRNILKLLKYTLIITFISIIGYLIIINNDTLYSLVGYRIENIVQYLLSDGETSSIDSSMVTRLSLIDKAKQAIQLSPYTGWGLDNFSYLFNKGENYTHNNFLEILVSSGLIGFVIYYAKYVYIIISLASCRKFADVANKKNIDIFLTLIFVMIVLEYWQITYYTRKFMIVWILILAYTQSRKRLRKSTENNLLPLLEKV